MSGVVRTRRRHGGLFRFSDDHLCALTREFDHHCDHGALSIDRVDRYGHVDNFCAGVDNDVDA